MGELYWCHAAALPWLFRDRLRVYLVVQDKHVIDALDSETGVSVPSHKMYGWGLAELEKQLLYQSRPVPPEYLPSWYPYYIDSGL